MKRIILIIISLCLLCLTSCSKKEENVNLNGVGLKELIEVDIPSGYKPEKNVIYNDHGGEIISKHYGKDKTSIYFMILSYKGKAVMGSDETIDEWYKNSENIVDEVSIEQADSNIFIYPIGINKRSKNADGSVIEGVFGYKDYVIMVGMFSHDGTPPLTDEQIKIFYNMLKTIKLQ